MRRPLRSLLAPAVDTLLPARFVADARPDALIVACAAPSDGDPDRLPALMRRARAAAGGGWIVARLSPLSAGTADAELDALRPTWPDAVLLPGCVDGRDVQHCGVKLGVREAQRGDRPGATAIIAAPGATGFLALGSFRGASPRLAGLLREDGAGFDDADATAVLRILLRLAACAAAVAAYDTVPIMPRGPAPPAIHTCGFDGLATRDPAAVAAINAAFSPPAAGAVSPGA